MLKKIFCLTYSSSWITISVEYFVYNWLSQLDEFNTQISPNVTSVLTPSNNAVGTTLLVEGYYMRSYYNITGKTLRVRELDKKINVLIPEMEVEISKR